MQTAAAAQAKSPRRIKADGGGNGGVCDRDARQAASTALSAAAGHSIFRQGGGSACVRRYMRVRRQQRRAASVRLSANVDGGVTDGLRVDG